MPHSVQLYSLRTHLEADLEATLARVAEIGYTRVEPYRIVADGRRLGAALQANDLAAPSAHAPLLSEDQDAIFTAAADLGISTVICPSTPAEQWRQAGGIEAIAESLNAAAQRGAEYGVRVGYHNHWWEFPDISGRSGMEYLASQLAPEVVLEIDTYWAAVAGVDPIALITDLGDRVRYLHLKDGPITTVNTEQVALGAGQMPVQQILAAADHLEVGVVELDDHDGDMFAAVDESLRYLNGLGQGK